MKIIKDKIIATFENGIIYKNKLLFVDMNLNELFLYDPDADSTKSICVIKEENANGERLFGAIIAYYDEIVLVPCSANNIYRVNMNTGEYSYIKIQIPDFTIYKDYMPESKFMSAFLVGNEIWMIGSTYPAIVKYDLCLERVKYFSDWIPEISEHINNFSDRSMFRKALLMDGMIYAPCCKANVVLIFDIKNEKYTIIEVGGSEANFSGICFDGNDFWLSSRHGNDVVKWNIESGKYSKLSLFPSEYIYKEYGFCDIVFWKGKIYLIPLSSNIICFIERGKNSIEILEYAQDECGWMSHFSDGKKINFISAESGKMIETEDGHTWVNREIRLPNQYKCRVSKLYKYVCGLYQRKKDDIFYEDYSNALFDFISYREKRANSSDMKSVHYIGSRICKEMKK